MSKNKKYPAGAFSPNGELWWKLKFWPNGKIAYGDERKIAAWLAFNKKIGEKFDLPELRKALGDGLSKNDAEHLNRRVRALRRDGWEVPSGKHDPTVGPKGYRLDKVGWHPAKGDRPKDLSKFSSATRVKVLKRDGSRCAICGVGDGEPYPEYPERKAVMTVGHRMAGLFKGRGSIDNLQTECALCNESIRAGGGAPEDYKQVKYAVEQLRNVEKESLREWILMGRRARSSLDVAFDRFRKLSPAERKKIARMLEKRSKAK